MQPRSANSSVPRSRRVRHEGTTRFRSIVAAREPGALMSASSIGSGRSWACVTMALSPLKAIDTVMAEWKLSNRREALRSMFSSLDRTDHIQSA